MEVTNKMINKIMNKYKSIPKAARSGIWFVACSLLQKCISFITLPIFTRLMPVEEYGLYSTYLSWYSFLTTFCTLNMHSVLYVNNYTKANTKAEKDFSAIPLLSLSLTLTSSIFLIYIFFHKSLDNFIGLPFYLTCLLFIQILFELPVNFWSTQQKFEYNYIKLVVLTISIVILNSSLGILFVWIANSNEAIARACSIVLVQIIFGGIFYLYFWRKSKKVFSTLGWKHALDVQLPLLPHNLSLTILSSSDRIMITNMIGAAQAGIYSVAYSAGYVVNMLKNSIIEALKPWIYQKIKEKDYQAIRNTVNIIIVLVFIISVLFTAFAPEIIHIVAPSKYYEAIYVIPPIAASSYFTFLYNVFSIVGMYYEKAKKIMIASLSGAILNLILNFICIPIFGYISSAYTTLICYIFFAFAHYIIMISICKQSLNNCRIYDEKFILIISILVIIETIIFTFTYNNIILRYIIIIILLIIIFIKRNVFISTIKNLKKGNLNK